MLIRNHRQEVMCRAYVQAVAGRCGLSSSFRDFDYGIDMTLHDIRRRGRRHMESGFKLDVQAKSTTATNLTDKQLLYDLAVSNYDDLRDAHVGCPRILVVLVLPEEEAQWITQTEDQFLLRRCAYWSSLRGLQPTGNRKSVRLQIERANVFSVESLQSIMDKVRRKVEL